MRRVITTSISDKTWNFLKEQGIGWSDCVEGYAAILLQNGNKDTRNFIKDRSEAIAKQQNIIAKLSSAIFEKLGETEYRKIFEDLKK